MPKPLGHPAGTGNRYQRETPEGAFRADDGIRTRDPNLGKVVLYQLSYSRNAVLHLHFHPVEVRGIEPLTS